MARFIDSFPTLEELESASPEGIGRAILSLLGTNPGQFSGTNVVRGHAAEYGRAQEEASLPIMEG